MLDNCLLDRAQFRYLGIKFKPLLHNIKFGGSLATYYNDVKYKKRVFICNGINQQGIAFENSKKHFLKQSSSGSLVFYNQAVNSCAQPDGIYVDQKRKECHGSELKFTFGKEIKFFI